MRLSRTLIQATALPIIALFLLPSIQIQALTSQPEQAEYRSLYATVEIKPDSPQPGKIMTIETRVEDVNGPIDDVVIKILLTFANGRQNSFFGKSDYNGIFILAVYFHNYVQQNIKK